VKQASRVLDKELGSFHKGLHLADDVRTLGELRVLGAPHQMYKYALDASMH